MPELIILTDDIEPARIKSERPFSRRGARNPSPPLEMAVKAPKQVQPLDGLSLSCKVSPYSLEPSFKYPEFRILISAQTCRPPGW